MKFIVSSTFSTELKAFTIRWTVVSYLTITDRLLTQMDRCLTIMERCLPTIDRYLTIMDRYLTIRIAV